MTFTTFIQWKGTDICMDFICPECGENSHYTGLFAYYIRCPGCNSVFEMPTDVPVKKVEAGSDVRALNPEDHGGDRS